MTSDEIEIMWCRCEGQGLPGVAAFAEQVARQAISEALISVSHAVAEEREACGLIFDELREQAVMSKYANMRDCLEARKVLESYSAAIRNRSTKEPK